jgi:hypothetical protein
MYENVRFPVVASNETVPLLMIEPLDVSCYSIRHFASSPLFTSTLATWILLHFNSRLLIG